MEQVSVLIFEEKMPDVYHFYTHYFMHITHETELNLYCQMQIGHSIDRISDIYGFEKKYTPFQHHL